MRDFAVGDRVRSEGSAATVRYVGAVEGQDAKKVWVGVEWDEPGRGKHDGTAGGTRYFACPPGQGSFLKERKVDGKESLAGHLVYRYCGGGSGGDAADTRRSRAVVIDPRSQVQARFVGMEELASQQSDLKKLVRVALLDAGISCLSWPGRPTVAELAPNIEELDLAGNLLTDWRSVEELGAQLPNLRSLDLRGNRLQVPECTAGARFGQLRVLVLNSTRMTWPDAVSCSRQIPLLRELHMAKNQLTSLSAGCDLPDAFPSLDYLDLDSNEISEWSEVRRLAHLPCLKKLTMSSNQLLDITMEPPTASSHGVPFSSLQCLSVDSNALGKVVRPATEGGGWAPIVALSHLPALSNLRCIGNPLFDGLDAAVARNLVIGRLPQVATLYGNPKDGSGFFTLDGSAVLITDRVMAEKVYLRQCHTEMHAGGTTAEAVAVCHPRFAALNALYEDVQHEKFGADAQKSRLSANLIEVSIRSSVAVHAGKPPVVKRLTLTMTVGKLKGLCQKLFKVKGGPRKMKLVYIAEGDSCEVPLDVWDLDLQYYSMESMGAIVVS